MISSSRVKRGTGNLKRALCENKKQTKEKLLFLAYCTRIIPILNTV